MYPIDNQGKQISRLMTSSLAPARPEIVEVMKALTLGSGRLVDSGQKRISRYVGGLRDSARVW